MGNIVLVGTGWYDMNQETDGRTVDLRLTLPDAQLVLNALSERPHREVSGLIPALMAQIQNQLRSPTAEEES